MPFQPKARPSNDIFQLDFLDKLYDLDYLGDSNGTYRNSHYLYNRHTRNFENRKHYLDDVINPLMEKELISSFKDQRFPGQGLSYELTPLGREYLRELDVEFDKELARQILRLILKEEAVSLIAIVIKIKGKARLVNEHLLSLIIRGILDYDDSRYDLTATAYLTAKEVKELVKTKLIEEVEPENKERFENLLAQLLEEDD